MSGGERPAISMPSSRMRPESGFNAPVMRLKNVLLPAPLGPITAVSDPSAKFNVISSAALTPPNDLESCCTSSIALTIRLPEAAIGAPRRADQPSAIDRHIGAGHRGSGIGRQKRHHACDFSRIHEAAQ